MTTQELRLLPSAEVWRDSRSKVIQAHGGGVMHFDGVYYWFGENREVETIGGIRHRHSGDNHSSA